MNCAMCDRRPYFSLMKSFHSEVHTGDGVSIPAATLRAARATIPGLLCASVRSATPECRVRDARDGGPTHETLSTGVGRDGTAA